MKVDRDYVVLLSDWTDENPHEVLRTLKREPARLDQMAVLIDDLQRAPEGRALLPERFEEIWHAVYKKAVLIYDSAHVQFLNKL